MYICIYAYMYICIYVYMYMCIYVYMHMHICRIYIYTHNPHAILTFVFIQHWPVFVLRIYKVVPPDLFVGLC